MSKQKVTLEAVTPLNNLHCQIEGLIVSEITNYTLYCVSIPQVIRKDAKKMLEKHCSMVLPEVGMSVNMAKHNMRILRVSVDQFFLLCDNVSFADISDLPSGLKTHFYITDQTDAFAFIKAKGEKLMDVLKFMCRLDMDSFPVDGITRSLMEHQGHYILRDNVQEVTFFTPRSSCCDFPLLHYV